MSRFLSISILTCCSTFAATSRAADAPKPLKALLIAGGCCHDYKTQKDILKKGIEERAIARVAGIGFAVIACR
ncbi:MAG: hypothetical protein NTY01_25660 [Verrucomicrobia bacterium]|nr:hypothetical protein [Verrucomicrobiota bacterium]